MTTKLSTPLTLKGKQLSDIGKKLVKDNSFLGDHVIGVRYAATRTGKNINGGIYDPKGAKKALKSWYSPKPKPIILGHQDMMSPSPKSIGSIRKAVYHDFWGNGEYSLDNFDYTSTYHKDGGMGIEYLYGVISDIDAITKIVAEELVYVSVGRKDTAGGVCTSCGSPANRYACDGSKNIDKDGSPLGPHYMGEWNDEKKRPHLCHITGWDNRHLAHISHAFTGDANAVVEEVFKSTGKTLEDSLDPFGIFAIDGESGKAFDLTCISVFDSCSEDSNFTDILKVDEDAVGIYPVNVELEDDLLPQAVYEKVKEKLGSKRVTGKELKNLADNAFVGPNRTWPAHRKEYVEAGLIILNELDLRGSVYHDVHYELLRRLELFGSSRETVKMDEKEFVDAHIIFSLDKAGCLADREKAEQNPHYQKLLSLLDKGELSNEQFGLLQGSVGVGPSNAFPALNDSYKEAGTRLMDHYVGPVTRETLLDKLKIESEKPKKAKNKMELSEIVDFLNSQESGTETIDSLFTKVPSLRDLLTDRIQKATKPLTDTVAEKDAKIKELNDSISEIQAKTKIDLVDQLISLRVNAGILLPEDVDTAEKKKTVVDELSKRSLDSIRDSIADLSKFATHVDPKVVEPKLSDESTTQEVEPKPAVNGKRSVLDILKSKRV